MTDIPQKQKTDFDSATPEIPAPIVPSSPALIEKTVLVPNPALNNSTEVTDGSVLIYTRETGVSLPAFQSRNRHVNRENGLELEPGVDYHVGDDLSIELARRLVERGVLAIKG